MARLSRVPAVAENEALNFLSRINYFNNIPQIPVANVDIQLEMKTARFRFIADVKILLLHSSLSLRHWRYEIHLVATGFDGFQRVQRIFGQVTPSGGSCGHYRSGEHIEKI